MKILNLLFGLFMLTLIGLSCQKESVIEPSILTNVSPQTSLTDVQSVERSVLLFKAIIVSRRTDPIQPTELDMYYQQIYAQYPTCGTILYDETNDYYFGTEEIAEPEYNGIEGYDDDSEPSSINHIIIIQPQLIIGKLILIRPPFNPLWKYLHWIIAPQNGP
jgi:hypothetical protein